jgi:hypothetical protein
MTRRPFTWVIAAGVIAVLVAGMIDAVHSSRPSGSAPIQTATAEDSAARETAIPVETTAEGLPLCTAQNIGVSIDVLGGTAAVVVRHVWGRPCDLAPLTVRLGVTDLVGRRVRLASLSEGPVLPSHIEGDFAPGFEALIDITYLAKPQLMSCASRGPFTAFVIVGPYSAQRKLSGSEVGCFRGG